MNRSILTVNLALFVRTRSIHGWHVAKIFDIQIDTEEEFAMKNKIGALLPRRADLFSFNLSEKECVKNARVANVIANGRILEGR